LLFAFRTALSAAAVVGSFEVIAHPIDDGVRRFYAKWGLSICLSIQAGR
jgi:hypothetical protein